MKKMNFKQKIGLGMIFFSISISIVLKEIFSHQYAIINFSQGFCLSLGLVLLIVGAIQKRKSIG